MLNDYWKDYPGLSEKLAAVSLRIKKEAAGFSLSEKLEPLLEQRGKMLRPAFLILGSGFGEPNDSIVDAAAAVEMLHIATLLHDDILDDAETRRGQKSMHISTSIKHAVLAGDWLFARAVSLVVPHISAEQSVLLTGAITKICNAEVDQDLRKGFIQTSRRAYLRTIAGKTSALMALSLRAGAELSGAPRSCRLALQRLGYNIGMAFQIQDDILDYSGDSGTFKKPTGKDIQEGLCTLPLICALKKAGIADTAGLPELSAANLRFYQDMVKKHKGTEDAYSYAERYTERALRELSGLPDCEAKTILGGIISRLSARKF